MAREKTNEAIFFVLLMIGNFGVIFGFTFLLIGGLYLMRDNSIVLNYIKSICKIASSQIQSYRCGRKSRGWYCYSVIWKVYHGDNYKRSATIEEGRFSAREDALKRSQAFKVR